MDHIENDASNSSSVVACIFVAAATFLLSRCLATIRGYTYRYTDWWERFMKYAVEMGSVAIVYIPSFIKSGSSIQKLMWGIHKHTDNIVIL
jgi:branched-subunit amino acid transport protein